MENTKLAIMKNWWLDKSELWIFNNTPPQKKTLQKTKNPLIYNFTQS